MACTITDKLLDAAGTAKVGGNIFAYPIDNTIRVKDGGGTYRSIEPATNIGPPYQYGMAALSAGDGAYSLVLPDSSQQLPSASRWRLVLPDGKTLEGAPPTAGTYLINDLIVTHGWTWVQGQTVVAAGNDYEKGGEVSITGAPQAVINFQTPMASSSYSVEVGFQTDQVSGGVGGAPGWSWTARSQNGITIQFSSSYTGVMTYRLKVIG